jgi:hypothetical protein
MMRQWAGPIGFVGSAASLVFWLVVPYVGAGANLSRTGAALCVVFAVLSAAGLVGAWMAGASTRLAPALLAIAIAPAIGALLVPGVLVSIAALLALQPLEAPAPGRPLGGEEK